MEGRECGREVNLMESRECGKEHKFDRNERMWKRKQI
jgi:hypothetical protein